MSSVLFCDGRTEVLVSLLVVRWGLIFDARDWQSLPMPSMELLHQQQLQFPLMLWLSDFSAASLHCQLERVLCFERLMNNPGYSSCVKPICVIASVESIFLCNVTYSQALKSGYGLLWEDIILPTTRSKQTHRYLSTHFNSNVTLWLRA